MLAALLMCGVVTAKHSPQLSPLDEWVYYDYVLKIPEQGIVKQGELIGEGALEAMACFGDTFGPRGEACDGDYGDEHSVYPQEGKTTADLYTPIYFTVTWVLAKPIELLTGIEFLTAARLTGFFWLAGGLLVFTSLMRRFWVPQVVTLGLGLAIIASPSTTWTYTYLSTDAPMFLVGAALLLLALNVVRGDRRALVWLTVAGVLGIWLKVTSILAVGLVVGFLLLKAIWNRTRERIPSGHRFDWRLIRAALAVGGAAVAAELVWLFIRASIAVGEGPSQGVATVFAWRDVAGLSTIFFSPGPLTTAGYLDTYGVPYFFTYPLSWLCIAGVIALALATRHSPLRQSLGAATLVAAVLFAPVLALVMNVLLGQVFPVLPRYGMSLAPAFVVAASTVLRNRLGRALMIVYGTGLYAIVLYGAVVAAPIA